MKKKFMLCAAALFAAAAITISSCSNPANKVVNLYKDATEQVTKAKSYDELKEIEKNLEEKLEKVYDDNKDFEPNEEQLKALAEAHNTFQKAWRKAKRDLR